VGEGKGLSCAPAPSSAGDFGPRLSGLAEDNENADSERDVCKVAVDLAVKRDVDLTGDNSSRWIGIGMTTLFGGVVVHRTGPVIQA